MSIKHLYAHAETAGPKRGYSGKNGLYVSVKATAQATQLLTKLSRELGLTEGLDRQQKMHCTVMWSKQTPHTPRPAELGCRYKAAIQNIEYWNGHDGQGYLVVGLESPDLVRLHEDWSERGCSHSFSDYTAHVTLADGLPMTEKLATLIPTVLQEYKGKTLDFWAETLEDLKA